MGKKSKTKKAVRELIEKHESLKPLAKEDRKTLKKKIKNELETPKIAQKPTPKKQKNKVLKKSVIKAAEKLKKHSPKIKNALIVLTSGLLLLFLTWMIVLRAFGPSPVAKILPADRTVGFLELNMNQGNNQFSYLTKLLSKKEFDSTDFLKKTSQLFQLDFSNQIKPWLGRNAAIALINNRESADYYWFFEIGNKNVFNKFLISFPLDNKGIGKINEKNYFLPKNEYLIIAEKPEILEIFNMKSSFDPLYRDSKFRRIDDNLPISRLGFYYINFDQINEKSLKKIPYFNEKNISPELIAGTKQLFNSDGGAIIALKDRIAVQNFLSIKKDDYSNTLTSFNPKYRANLSTFVSGDAIAFWGGMDFSEQLTRVIEIVSAQNKNKNQLLTDVVTNYLSRNFGPDLNLEKDLYPLLNNEFALSLEKNSDDLFYKLIIQTTALSDREKIDKLTDSFVDIAASFTPTVVDYILPDGTHSRELVASKEQIKKEMIVHKNREITAKLLSKNNFGIYYALIDDIAIITTNLNGLKLTIDQSSQNGENLKNSSIYKDQILPLLKSADEISFFNVPQLSTIFFPEISTQLSSIKYFTTGNNYFYDGITSISTFTLNF